MWGKLLWSQGQLFPSSALSLSSTPRDSAPPDCWLRLQQHTSHVYQSISDLYTLRSCVIEYVCIRTSVYVTTIVFLRTNVLSFRFRTLFIARSILRAHERASFTLYSLMVPCHLYDPWPLTHTCWPEKGLGKVFRGYLYDLWHIKGSEKGFGDLFYDLLTILPLIHL